MLAAEFVLMLPQEAGILLFWNPAPWVCLGAENAAAAGFSLDGRFIF
jgi:hypothetical protein